MTHKLIPLTKGKFVKVSPEDFEYLSQFKWYYASTAGGYAIRGEYVKGSGKKNQKMKHILMHREIMKAQKGQFIDHINFDPLDNTRENLRIVSFQQNNFHITNRKNNTSGYKGIHWDKKYNGWIVQIWKDYKVVYGKAFKNLRDAVIAYNKAVTQYHGKYAIVHPLPRREGP